MKQSANVNALNVGNVTPLHVACDMKIVSTVLSNSMKRLLAFGAYKPPKDKCISEVVIQLFNRHFPVGTLKAQSARACIRNRIDIQNESIPRECKNYVLTDVWMSDFFNGTK